MLRQSIIALSMLTALAVPAYASGLNANQRVEIAIVDTAEDGTTITNYVPAEKIAPGDELRYIVAYQNDGDAAAENIRLDMPVPAEIELIEDSIAAENATITYSIDAGQTFAARDALTVTEAGETRAANADDITHIRWSFDTKIAPGEAGTISYRGILQ